MKVVIHAKKVSWHTRYFEFFKSGFSKHAIKVEVDENPRPRYDADVALLFGPNYWKKLENQYSNYLMVNRCFLGNENDNVAISWNGFNGLGTFCVRDAKASRLARLEGQYRLLPWRVREAGCTLLLGQYDLGRCGRYVNLMEWHSHVEANSPLRVRVRPWPGNTPMEIDCRDAVYAASLNSTAAVKTLLLGVPTIAMHEQSPVYPICPHNFGDVFKSEKRIDWLVYLANCQWHYKQIENGDFWRQLWPKFGPRMCDVKL